MSGVPQNITDEIALNDSDLDALARIFEVLAQWDFEERQSATKPVSSNGPAP